MEAAMNEVRSSLTVTSPGQYALLGVSCATSFALGWRGAVARRSWRRLSTMMDVTSNHVGPDAPFLRGRVVSVSDGDTLRVLHVPSRLFHSSTLDEGEKKSDSTLQIRVCTIDTPETKKFGKDGQPFGEEAKQYLSVLILDKMVRIRVLQKDQYGRGVAEVIVPGPFLGFPTKYADEEMLKAGLAEVYQGSGAVYGNKGKDAYLALAASAEASKKGMWSLANRETAAEYKARMKAEG
ncbi:putative endonuclease LCL3 [Diplonema papillatum]|nr:putative endonuclease LCL3 [Diplonema papillatum]